MNNTSGSNVYFQFRVIVFDDQVSSFRMKGRAEVTEKDAKSENRLGSALLYNRV
jgi:hypothetical protein